MQGDPFLRAKMTVLACVSYRGCFLTLNYRCERNTHPVSVQGEADLVCLCDGC